MLLLWSLVSAALNRRSKTLLYSSHSNILRTMNIQKNLENDFIPSQFSNLVDLSASSIYLECEVTAKRHIGQHLVFFNVTPYVADALPTLAPTKYSWKSAHSPNTSLAIQLIVGQTLLQKIGGEGVRAICKSTRAGHVLRILGRLGGMKGEGVVDSITTDLNGQDEVNMSIDIIVEDITTFIPSARLTKAAAVPKLEAPSIASEPTENGKEESEKPTIDLPFIGLDDLDSIRISSSLASSNPTSSWSLNLPTSSIPIIIVDGEESLGLFAAEVERMVSLVVPFADGPNPLVIGLDCEWKPGDFHIWGKGAAGSRKKGGLSPLLLSMWNEEKDEARVDVERPVEILSIATREAIYLFDIPKLTAQPSLLSLLQPSLAALFSCPRIYKIGFQMVEDLERVVAALTPPVAADVPPSTPLNSAVKEINSALDLWPLARLVYRPGTEGIADRAGVSKKHGGLNRLCSVSFGKRLCKDMQLSPWHRRPLSEAQKVYAALDAGVLIRLYDEMSEKLGEDKNFEEFLEKQKLVFNIGYVVESPPVNPSPSSDIVDRNTIVRDGDDRALSLPKKDEGVKVGVLEDVAVVDQEAGKRARDQGRQRASKSKGRVSFGMYLESVKSFRGKSPSGL